MVLPDTSIPWHFKIIWGLINHLRLNGRSQFEMITYYMVLTLWHSGKGKIMETVKWSIVARGLGGERGELV